LVAQEVSIDINGPLVEVAIAIIGIARFLVSVDSPIGKVQYFVFDLDNIDSLRIEVEGHVFVTPDVHKGTINSE